MESLDANSSPPITAGPKSLPLFFFLTKNSLSKSSFLHFFYFGKLLKLKRDSQRGGKQKRRQRKEISNTRSCEHSGFADRRDYSPSSFRHFPILICLSSLIKKHVTLLKIPQLALTPCKQRKRQLLEKRCSGS